MLVNSERENHRYNLIPERMNSRGTDKQEKKIFLHLYNSEKKKKKATVKIAKSRMCEYEVNMALIRTTLGPGYPPLFDLLQKISGKLSSTMWALHT